MSKNDAVLNGSLKDLSIWVYWHPFKGLIQKIPLRYLRHIHGVSDIIIPRALPGKKRLMEGELERVFGLRQPGAEDIVKRTFSLLIQNELEVLLFPRLNPGNIGQFIEYSGLDNLDTALEGGRGVMLLFAHFGANQMVMPAIGYKGYRMSQMSAPPTVWVEKMPEKKFSPMAKKALELRWEHELSLPVTHVNIFGSLKKALMCLKSNEVLGIAMDGGGGTDKVRVDLLGKKASLSTGAMKIAARSGCAVLPTFMVRGADRRHRIIIEKPLKISGPGDEHEKVRRATACFAKRLEQYVVKYPCHYLNFLTLRKFMETQGEEPFLS
ncbi:MAG: lysophospholipid acyltransferase family protein [Thermodesulfobacteriota bacterium]